MPTERGMDKETVVHPWNTTCNTLWNTIQQLKMEFYNLQPNTPQWRSLWSVK